ncbi:tryptase-like [Misgurnus anguillicaudatus]|uniref:tryptase-like n=1 Tax=Misgurnus anguillicaudatus TaxID=75329 RepID=UPI003CCFD766
MYCTQNLFGTFLVLSSSVLSSVCGQAPFNTKIIGGGDATAGSWPWHVGITSAELQVSLCGGSLINKDWVLSSTFCINSYEIVIYLGRQSQRDPNPHQINRTVINVINHPDYNLSTRDNDIALLQLSSSVNFTDYIRPVCLAAAGSVFDEGLSSWATGWGVNRRDMNDFTDSDLPNILQEVEIPIVSNQNCSVAYNGSGVTITDNMLCAGRLNDAFKGPCFLDDGGPLVSKQGLQWIQTGITIMDDACFDKNITGVFTRVSQYQDWINSHISNEKPGFIRVNFTTPTPNTTPDPNPIPDPNPTPDPNATPDPIPTPDPNATPDPIPTLYFPDIFSGSSPSLQLFPLSLTFSIFSLIFCLFII